MQMICRYVHPADKKIPSRKTWNFFGGEEETRTPAPVTRPTPLAGAPRHQLEYFSVSVTNVELFGCF